MAISAVINTYNAEKYLDECLSALSSLDEIVICDMHSTDRTIEIAEKHGCKIIYHENLGFADPARNYAISHATSDWILVVDADEIAPKALLDYLKEKINNPDCEELFLIPRKNILLGKILWSWYPNQIYRFFKKGHMSFASRVHETPDCKGRTHEIDPQRTDLALIHYNYDSIEEFVSRSNRYTTLELEKSIERGKTAHLWYMLLRSLGEFIKKYFIKKGFKDGKHGFIFALYAAVYEFVEITKIWEYELKNREKNEV